jgi:hypothetical protein
MSERPAPGAGADGVIDGRLVEDAFPTAPAAIVDNELATQILEILRKQNAVEGELNEFQARVARTEQHVTNMVATSDATGQAVKHLTETVRAVPAAAVQQAQEVMAHSHLAATLTAQAIGARLAAAGTFVMEHVATIGSLAAAFWLWDKAMPNPEPMQLATLALWLPIVAVSFWWGRK